MNKIFKLNYKWRFFLFGFSFILVFIIAIFIPVYIAERRSLILGLILIMIVLAGFLVFGALSTKIIVSADGLISFAFGKSKLISWKNFEKIEINPVNSMMFAKLTNPPNEIFAISPFIKNIFSGDLLLE